MSHSRKNRFLLSLTVGLALPFVFFAVLIFLFPSVGFNLFLFPGQLLAPVIGPLVPDGIVYVIAPEGGSAAALVLFVFGSFLFWGLAFVAVSFFLMSQFKIKTKRGWGLIQKRTEV